MHQVSRIISSAVSVREQVIVSHMRPLLKSQEDGIDPATDDARANSINHCSTLLRLLVGLVSDVNHVHLCMTKAIGS